MRGIILVAPSSAWLNPMTDVIPKQVLPVYDKPMIYHPLGTLMLAGVREIMLIAAPRDLPTFRNLLGDGSQWGLTLSYFVLPNQGGVAQALLTGQEFLCGHACALVLGDNLFYGQGLSQLLTATAHMNRPGATLFAYNVRDPENYDVVEFDGQKNAVSIEKKPKAPKSSWAVTGLYFFDKYASDFMKSLTASLRVEPDITDLSRLYLQRGEISVERLGNGFAWLDVGTPDALVQAAEFTRALEKRQGFKVACPEEIAFRSGWISGEQVLKLASRYKGDYGDYLRTLTIHC